MSKYNLDNWQFKWTNASRRFGSCNKKKRIISLSKLHGIYDDIELVKDTILHEIAHGLTPDIYLAHGKQWKEIALTIGCNPKSYKKSSVSDKHSCKYKGICSNCNKIIYVNKRSNLICRSCYNNYSLNCRFNYSINYEYLGNKKID
jgi:hypothetical protein